MKTELPPKFQQALEEQRIRDSPHMKEMIGIPSLGHPIGSPKFGITKIECVPLISTIASSYNILNQYKVSARTHGGWMTQKGYINKVFTVYSVASKSPISWIPVVGPIVGPISFALMFEDYYVEDPAAGQSGYVNNVTPVIQQRMTFNERVSRAVDIVKKQYPKAQLYEAEASSPKLDAKLDHLQVVFCGEDNTTIRIAEKSVGVFGEPQLIRSPWFEDVVIEWPIKMDLPKAKKLKQAAGYTDSCGCVVLRTALGPKKVNPSFIFGGDESKPYIFVDTVTGKVTSTADRTSKADDVPADCNGVKPTFPPMMPGPVIIGNKMMKLNPNRKEQCLPNKNVTGYITEHRMVGTHGHDEPAPTSFRSADKSVVTCKLVNTTPRNFVGGEIYQHQFIAHNFGRTTVTNGSTTYTIQVGLL